MRIRLAASLLLMAALPCAARTVLTLEASALAAGARVTLSDVAHGADGAKPAALGAIDLGAAPLPGYTLRLTRAEIARTLRARALPYELAPDGPAAVRVERRTQPFDQARVAQAAEQALRELASAQQTRIELQLSAPLPELPLPAGAASLRVRPLAPQLLRQRRATAWVDIAVDGVFFRAVPVGFELRAWRPVLVAARDLAPGSAPGCADLHPQETELTALPGTPIEDCAGLQGRLARPLARGDALLQNHLKTMSAVAQGDSVTLQFADGAIVLESRATALADGSVGERIDVRPSGAQQPIRAEVAGAGLVRITGR